MTEWLKANVLIVLMCIQFLVGTTLWVSSLANSSGSNSSALVTVNARLDRIFEKLDGLPVMAEQVKELQAQMADAKGSSGSLEARLRLLEQNVAAVHAEATDPHKRP